VSLQAAIEQVLPELRAEAEARMLDTWTIGADVGWVYNETTDVDVQTVTPLFTTQARMKVSTTQVREAQAGERTTVESRRELHIPIDSPAVPVNAVAECTAVDATSDPTLLGTIVRLSGSVVGSQTTARRLEVVEVLS
jgi:hypothetical protein